MLAAVLAVNFLWLLGFSSFLLGCCLFPITLGVWWPGRDRPEPRRLAVLAALLVLGYFGHLVSLGLTVVGMGYLALFSPAQSETSGWLRTRLRRLKLMVLPCLPLALWPWFT